MTTFLPDKDSALLLKHLEALQYPNDDDQIQAIEAMCRAFDSNDAATFVAAWRTLKVSQYRVGGFREDLCGDGAPENHEQPAARAKNAIGELKDRLAPRQTLNDVSSQNSKANSDE